MQPVLRSAITRLAKTLADILPCVAVPLANADALLIPSVTELRNESGTGCCFSSESRPQFSRYASAVIEPLEVGLTVSARQESPQSRSMLTIESRLRNTFISFPPGPICRTRFASTTSSGADQTQIGPRSTAVKREWTVARGWLAP